MDKENFSELDWLTALLCIAFSWLHWLAQTRKSSVWRYWFVARSFPGCFTTPTQTTAFPIGTPNSPKPRNPARKKIYRLRLNSFLNVLMNYQKLACISLPDTKSLSSDSLGMPDDVIVSTTMNSFCTCQIFQAPWNIDETSEVPWLVESFDCNLSKWWLAIDHIFWMGAYMSIHVTCCKLFLFLLVLNNSTPTREKTLDGGCILPAAVIES